MRRYILAAAVVGAIAASAESATKIPTIDTFQDAYVVDGFGSFTASSDVQE